MSFSQDVKNEIARQLPDDYHCLLAEIASIIHYAGTISGTAESGTILIETGNVVLAKKYLRLIKKAFDITVNLDIKKRSSGKNNLYKILLSSESDLKPADSDPDRSGEGMTLSDTPETERNETAGSGMPESKGNETAGSDVPEPEEHATAGAEELLDEIYAGDKFSRVWMETADWEQPGFQESLLEYPCCRRAFIRGAFLTSGSISNPGKSYHFEIACRKMQGAEELCKVMETFDIHPKIIPRKNKVVAYLKDSTEIVDILNVMNAPNALMKLENVRIIKDMKNSANRQYNCDSANINKMVRTAKRQLEDISLIRNHLGLEKLPPALRQMAEVRLEHPDESLMGLGNYLDPPVGKSGVNHRLKKLEKIAEELRAQAGITQISQ